MPTELVIDGRDLEPPQPLERVLAALERLERGQSLRVLLQREPWPLYTVLDQLGCTHRTRVTPGGGFEVHIEAGRAG